MGRQTLLDFFEDIAKLDGPFLVHDDGYASREVSYRELADAARRFAARLADERVAAGENVVVWSENRNEWVAAFWGCALAGVVVVPVDFRASGDYLARISRIVAARVVLAGDEVELPDGFETPVWLLRDAITFGEPRTGNREPGTANREPGSLLEIIFTSGATGDPKGVTITHRNVLANIVPIEREVRKYLRYERPFHPIRFLNLLPLSHMFGQSLATFVPPMLGGTVVFSHGYSPVEILRQIKSRRVSVLVCVPKVLDVLRHHVERVRPETAEPDALAGRHWLWRWWRYRRVHRLFGWKFWAVLVGAAPLDPELEGFWRKLGFVVVQGYGLTETAPVVTLNHPFRASKGSVGTPLAGVEVRIAPDGEILVRGENVTSGYYRGPGQPPSALDAFEDGWFHTGDIGELDSAGRLVIKGRKKEMIVTPQGLNVYPEDVERAIAEQPGVIDVAVVGLPAEGEERVHAVLVVEPGADVQAIVRGANAGLEDHQRVRSTAVWPGDALPRTEGTSKLRRKDIQRWAAGGASIAAGGAAGRSVEDVVARFAAGRPVGRDTSLEELGLSSLDRVELLMALEEAFQTTLDETELASASTVRDLGALVEPRASAAAPASSEVLAAPAAGERRATSRVSSPSIAFPAWNRSRAAWLLRRLSLPTWILPLGRIFMKIEVNGLDRLRDLRGPVVFAANHQSLLDVPAILLSLPAVWRYRIAPAMAKELFAAHFNPSQTGWQKRAAASLKYYLACQFFNAFPIPQREAGTRQTMRYMGEVAADGYSPLIFPEGQRTWTGEITRFQPGVGMIASRLDLPVVPVRLEGLDRVLHRKMRFPERGPVRVTFGEPLRAAGDDYADLASRIEAAVRALGEVQKGPEGPKV